MLLLMTVFCLTTPLSLSSWCRLLIPSLKTRGSKKNTREEYETDDESGTHRMMVIMGGGLKDGRTGDNT